jgi:hypothetical protein
MTIHLRRRTIALILAAFLAVTALSTVSFVRTLAPAEADHKFSDIATGTFFHEPTAWLADNGIALGFNDGTFRPNQGITRGQAAFWFANYNNSIEVVDDDFDPLAASAFSFTTDCPVGKRALTGGGDTTAFDLMITDSHPKADVSLNPDGWKVRWETDNGVQVNPSRVRVWALCAPDSIAL